MFGLADARSIHSSGCSSSWPSQLEVVGQILQKTFAAHSKVHVQKMSGDEKVYLNQKEATLRDLKAAIVEAEGLSTDLYEVSLRLGLTCLRDEFNTNERRWKFLSEYGIDDGSTLGMITQPRLADGVVAIAVQKSSGGGPWPIEIDARATLDDLKAIICAEEGLAWQTFGDPPLFLGYQSTDRQTWQTMSIGVLSQDPSQNGIGLGISSDRSLAEHGIEEGTTLVYKLVRPPLCDVQNLVNSQSVDNVVEAPHVVRSNGAALTTDRLELPLMAHSDEFQQRTDHDIAFAQPNTPPNRPREDLSQMPSVCKDSRSRELRAKKMQQQQQKTLKRL